MVWINPNELATTNPYLPPPDCAASVTGQQWGAVCVAILLSSRTRHNKTHTHTHTDITVSPLALVENKERSANQSGL